jgi:Zn-dependent M28 family amino/carboxypeptidase
MQHTAQPGHAATLLAEIPGRGPEIVIVSAHYDGHDLAESAIDNASGTAVALELARAFTPLAGRLPCGVRITLFTVEEWGLHGSARYVDALPPDARRSIAFVLNLDSVVGNGRIAFLTGGFPELDSFLRETARAVGIEVDTINRLMGNSDHFNFARCGIPAVRMMSGFNDPNALTRFLLTPADTRDKVQEGELKLAALVAAQVALAAACHPKPLARHRSASEIASLLAPRD